MAITKNEIKERMRLILMTIFTWMIVVNGQKMIIDIAPIKNQMILGIVGLLILLFWD